MTKAFFLGLLSLCVFVPGTAQQNDDAKCRDHSLFTRMPDSWIHYCKERKFDPYAFKIATYTTVTIEGHLWDIAYSPRASAKAKVTGAC